MMKFEIATARLDNERDELEADRKNCKTVLDTRAEFIRGGRCPSDKKVRVCESRSDKPRELALSRF